MDNMYEQLLNETISENERKAIKTMFIYIQCLKKYERLRKIYKES